MPAQQRGNGGGYIDVMATVPPVPAAGPRATAPPLWTPGATATANGARTAKPPAYSR